MIALSPTTYAILASIIGIAVTIYFSRRNEKDRELERQAKRALIDHDKRLVAVSRSKVGQRVEITLPDGQCISGWAQSKAVDIVISFDVVNHGATYATDVSARLKLRVPVGWGAPQPISGAAPEVSHRVRTIGRVAPNMRVRVAFDFCSELTDQALHMLEQARRIAAPEPARRVRAITDILNATHVPPNTLGIDLILEYDDVYGRHHREDHHWLEIATTQQPPRLTARLR